MSSNSPTSNCHFVYRHGDEPLVLHARISSQKKLVNRHPSIQPTLGLPIGLIVLPSVSVEYAHALRRFRQFYTGTMALVENTSHLNTLFDKLLNIVIVITPVFVQLEHTIIPRTDEVDSIPIQTFPVRTANANIDHTRSTAGTTRHILAKQYQQFINRTIAIGTIPHDRYHQSLPPILGYWYSIISTCIATAVPKVSTVNQNKQIAQGGGNIMSGSTPQYQRLGTSPDRLGHGTIVPMPENCHVAVALHTA
mmetsp:Transcript_10964/g.24552  ORF Transcript_10964/g.24552 Transcript_10964/m.24552 type:complete len:251 (-) Transcript_10964:767-1519(-)